MMELSENVSYMKLLHELKGSFPNMADDVIHQCIKQVRIIQTCFRFWEKDIFGAFPMAVLLKKGIVNRF